MSALGPSGPLVLFLFSNKTWVTRAGGVYAYATWADQLLPQLLMEQFHTLPKQCRHIEHMHEEI